MDSSDQHRQVLQNVRDSGNEFKIRKASWRSTPVYQDFTSFSCMVEFEFSIQKVFQEWFRSRECDHLRFHQERPRPPNSTKEIVTIRHRILKHGHPNKEMKGVFRALARELLVRLTGPKRYRSEMIMGFARETMNVINSSPAMHDRFLLEVDVTLVEFDFLPMPERVIQPGMVPATDESIKKLEGKVILATSDVDVTGDQDCPICLNELPAGFEAVSMPCSHTFHANCILKWLRTSHYCPMCRFEMPC